MKRGVAAEMLRGYALQENTVINQTTEDWHTGSLPLLAGGGTGWG